MAESSRVRLSESAQHTKETGSIMDSAHLRPSLPGGRENRDSLASNNLPHSASQLSDPIFESDDFAAVRQKAAVDSGVSPCRCYCDAIAEINI